MTKRPRIELFLVIASLILIFAASAAWGGDWPRWRGPNGNGFVADNDWDPLSLESGADILWQASVGMGYSSLAVSNGRVFTLGNTDGTDTVYSLDAETGDVLWEYSYRCATGQYPGPRATPTAEGGRVYTLSREGHLHCFHSETGDVIWRRHLGEDFRIQPPEWRFAGSPVVYGDMLVLNGGPSGLALDKHTGELIWDSGRRGGGYSTPVFYDHDGTPAAAILSNSAISGVELVNGDVLWSHRWRPTPDINGSDPVIHEKQAFMASGYNMGSGKVDFSGKPKLVWESRYFQTHFSSFVLKDGYLYGNDGDARRASSGVFRCIDFETGMEMWSTRLGFGSLIAAGDHLILLASIGTIAVAELTPEGYRETSRASLPRNQYWSPPAFSDGRLFVRNLRGDVYCVDLR